MANPYDNESQSFMDTHPANMGGAEQEHAPQQTAEASKEGSTDKEGKTADGEELKDREKKAADSVNYTGEEDGKGKKKKLKVDKNKFWNSKRAGLFGVAGGTIVGGGIFGLSLLAGPSQLLQIGAILHNPAKYSESTSAQSTDNLYSRVRAINNRTFTRTVLAKLGNQTFGHPIDQLAKIGITVEPGVTGQITKTTFDLDKLKAKFPDLAEYLNTEEAQRYAEATHTNPQDFLDDRAKAWIATETQIDPGSFKIDSDGKVSIDQTKLTVGESRLLAKSTVSLLGNGKIVSGIKTRLLFKIFNLPSVLHPFSRLKADLAKKAESAIVGSREQRAAATDALEEQVLDEASAPVVEEGQPAVDEVRDTDAKYGIAGKALTFTSGVCEVRSIAGKIPIINRLRIAVPAAIAAARFIAAAEQMKAGGKGITAKQIGDLLRSLHDAAGKGILNNNAPMESLARNSHSPRAPDISVDVQQGFSSETTASNIKAGASNVVGGETAAAALCSAVGQGIQAIASIGIAIADAVGEVASAGALTPALVGQVALKVGTQVAVSAVTLHYVEKFVLSATTKGKLTSSLLKGAAGGAILAYGARELSNIGSTSSGGIDMGNTTSTALLDEELQQEQQQFESQNFFARMFDPYESQSLLGHFMTDISPTYSDNLIGLSQSILHVGSMFSSIFSGFLPKVAADATQEVSGYDWTFGQTGIPQQMMKDPNLQDPYTNADDVANILDSTCLSNGVMDPSCSYITRIADCFGNTVNYVDGVWDVVATQDADPHSDTYIAANCNDIGTPADNKVSTGSYTNPGSARIIEASASTQRATITEAAAGSVNETGIWRRMIMFVNDTHTMKAAACFQGDNQSCTDEGLGIGIDATETDDTSNTSSTSAYDYWISPSTAQANLAAIGITP